MKAGDRLQSTVCEVQVIVIRPPVDDGEIRCGGAPMAPMDQTTDAARLDPEQADGTLLGKRYIDEATGVELLCTKAGAGSLFVNDTRLTLKEAKPLPSSD